MGSKKAAWTLFTEEGLINKEQSYRWLLLLLSLSSSLVTGFLSSLLLLLLSQW
jgi:hypothetical protein